MKILCSLVFVLTIWSIAVFSQPINRQADKLCDADLGRQLVEQQAIESSSIEETDKRIKILIRVADFLWDKDENAARKYFTEAFRTARDRFQEKGIIDTSDTKFLYAPEPDYRFSVIRAIGRYDTGWAESLTQEVLNEFDEDEEKQNRRSFDRSRELRETVFLAVFLLDKDPASARNLLRRAMNYPLDPHWFTTLYQLSQKNREFSDQIYDELLRRYRQAEISRLLYLSAYPFGTRTIYGPDKSMMGIGTQLPAVADPDRQQRFLTLLLNRIKTMTPETANQVVSTNIPESAYALGFIAEVEPIITQKFPNLKSLLSAAKSKISVLVTAEAESNLKKRESKTSVFQSSFDEYIETIREADETGKLTDEMIVNLIFKARQEDHFQQIENYLDKIMDSDVKESSTNYFYFSRADLAVREKRFVDVRKFAERIPQLQHRAVIFFKLAEKKMEEPLTRFESLEVLTEVFKMADKAPDSVEKAQVLLGLAYWFEKIDLFNAFEALSKTSATANKLDEPDLFKNAVTQRIIGRDFAYFVSYSIPGFDINQTFDRISKRDFQGALSQAKGFSDRYVRTLAVLATVKGCEQKPKAGAAKSTKM